MGASFFVCVSSDLCLTGSTYFIIVLPKSKVHRFYLFVSRVITRDIGIRRIWDSNPPRAPGALLAHTPAPSEMSAMQCKFLFSWLNDA